MKEGNCDLFGARGAQSSHVGHMLLSIYLYYLYTFVFCLFLHLMSAPKIRPRGIHQNPRPGTTDFEFGQKQAAQQLIYYHTLCAALQKKFSVSVSKGL